LLDLGEGAEEVGIWDVDTERLLTWGLHVWEGGEYEGAGGVWGGRWRETAADGVPFSCSITPLHAEEEGCFSSCEESGSTSVGDSFVRVSCN